MPTPRPAVFLDRDGTVIEDRNFLGDPAGVALLPGAAEAIARVNRAGVPVILVTNQSGIGRGFLSDADYSAVHARLVELLEDAGASLTAAYHCPHAPDQDPPCACRKPGDALFRQAADEHGLDLARSAYVGDRLRDVEPGARLGGRAFIVRSPATEPTGIPPEIPVLDSLREVVDALLAPAPAD